MANYNITPPPSPKAEEPTWHYLLKFLIELKHSGKVKWTFDEQQADPIHRMYERHLDQWIHLVEQAIKSETTVEAKDEPEPEEPVFDYGWESLGEKGTLAYRMKVFGGWVFTMGYSVPFRPQDTNDQCHYPICFIPDPEHKWTI